MGGWDGPPTCCDRPAKIGHMGGRGGDCDLGHSDTPQVIRRATREEYFSTAPARRFIRDLPNLPRELYIQDGRQANLPGSDTNTDREGKKESTRRPSKR